MVEANKIDSANSIIKAKIDSKILEEKKKKIAKEIAKKAKIQGFRPGKVPVKVVEKMYAEEIKRDAISEAVKEVLDEGIKQLGANEIIGEPQVIKFDEKEDGIDVEIKVFTKPEVNIDDSYKECVPDVTLPEVSEEEIEEELKKIAKQFAESKVVDKESLEKGDVAVIDFKGYIDSKPMENGSAESYPLEIGSGSFIEGFEDQLIGMKVGESKKIKVKFPKNYGAKEIAGKEAEFDVTLQEIQEKVPAEINDDLAKKYMNDENATLETLKNYIKDSILQRKKAETFAPLKEQILECLVEKYNFDLPENIVDQEVDVIVGNEAAKLTPAEIKELQENPEKLKEFREKFVDEAKNRVKLTFIIDVIAKKENVSVNDEELTQILYYEALMQGQNPTEYIKQVQEQGLIPVLKMNLIQEKLLNKLLEDKVKGE
ncbi:trigger factor [Caminibacter mediatlanticus]|uniref:Trigger factor n=1 Tax=Caminibacter mediatlanticus TB-2 TaxID=391592 RepID=A0AAI9F2B5_9BACT|nr:trigger factor [Caminibacter mediatlanticus]EDM23585.1 trigger factor [Caminibacter mediatlanticus TB-2]